MALNVVVKVFNPRTQAEEISRCINLDNRDQRDWLNRTIYWASGRGRLVQTYNVHDEGAVND